ncbi:MAG: hypothetical protein HY259_06035 [Chloroflexi bacterium]|nr:hypothetical protein [Chloroflexota bacterium]
MWLAACAAHGDPPPTATPPVVPTQTPAPWSPDPQSFIPSGARIANTMYVDSDGGGLSEWVVIYQDRGAGRGLVIRREGEGGRTYPLGGAPPAALFQQGWIATTVRDINGDGQIEIMVSGANRDGGQSINVFQWDGQTYASLLSLTGEKGVAIDDAENKGIYDFTALQLLFPRAAIIRTTHAEWRQSAYQQTSDVLFLLGSPIALSTPEEVTLAYYTYLRRGQTEQAFALLGEPQKLLTPLDALAALSRELDGASVETMEVVEESSSRAVVSLSVRTATSAAGQVIRLYVWHLQKENQRWVLWALTAPP